MKASLESMTNVTARCCQVASDHGPEPEGRVIGVPEMGAKPWHAFLRYARTIRYLEPIQICSRFRPRPSLAKVRKVARLRTPPGEWLRPLPKHCAQTGP